MTTTPNVEPMTDRHADAYAEARRHCPAVLDAVADYWQRSTSKHRDAAVPILAACIPGPVRRGESQPLPDVETVARRAYRSALHYAKKNADRDAARAAIRAGDADALEQYEQGTGGRNSSAPAADGAARPTDADRIRAAILALPPEQRATLTAAVDAYREQVTKAERPGAVTLAGALTAAQGRAGGRAAVRNREAVAAVMETLTPVLAAIHAEPDSITEPARSARQPAAPQRRRPQRLTVTTTRRVTGTAARQAEQPHPLSVGALPVPTTGTAPRWIVRHDSDHAPGHAAGGCVGPAYAVTHWHPSHRVTDPGTVTPAEVTSATGGAVTTYGPTGRAPQAEPTTHRARPLSDHMDAIHWTAPAPRPVRHWTDEATATAAAQVERPGRWTRPSPTASVITVAALIGADRTPVLAVASPDDPRARRALSAEPTPEQIAAILAPTYYGTGPDRPAQQREAERPEEKGLDRTPTHPAPHTDRTDAGQVKSHKVSEPPRRKRGGSTGPTIREGSTKQHRPQGPAQVSPWWPDFDAHGLILAAVRSAVEDDRAARLSTD